jgi:outer membrane protein OmpA-like peptidoglycan-associated protein
MKSRVLILLVSCALLALTAFAQQSTSSSSAQTSASASSTSPGPESIREPLTDPKPINFWDGDDPNVINLVTHPFARKAWIKRYLAPIRDRLNELDEITKEDAGRIKDIDSRSQRGIQLASDKADLANQHASDASTSAQNAQNSATQASTRVAAEERVVSNLDQYHGTAQTEIRFRPGQTVLSKQAKDALDQMAAPLKGEHNYVVEIHGYASGHGQAAIASSQKIADSVVRYLVETHQVPVYRIFVIAMGDAPLASDATAKRISGGRVEINLLKNDLVSTAQR